MDLTLWLAFVAASTALLLIPGPTVLLVLSYALSQGKRVAVASATGVALGDLIAMSLSLLGLGALVLASATLFTILKWVGAAYLVFLGVKLVREAGSAHALTQNAPPKAAGEILTHTALVTALNPKSIAFFIAFVPQFIDATAPLLPQFVILIATFVALAAVNALAYALLADTLRSRITRPSVQTWLARFGGAMLITMGALTALARRNPA
ncbi:LysE family translocator [Nereida sp. MMG025]|uniref:LysE family translocator n=1 Tax=Nereida sp. MMG025 TaxID=2909981 RepID=UPI001F3B7D63|nr:LysE family translocator [Nereida sp. MMG025]MCF6443625.1 LysE family translocator [Nereida sp. MMG025]